MRYDNLEAHQDLGLGAEELGMRRFTRPSERMGPRPVDSSHVEMGDPSGMPIDSMIDAIEDGRRNVSGADLIRSEALDSLERRIAHNWRVWEGLSEGRSRDQLAAFIHDLEDRADALTEDLNRGNTTPPMTSPAKNAVVEGDSTTQKEK